MKRRLCLIPALLLFPLALTSCSAYGVYANADKYLIGTQEYSDAPNTISIEWVSGKITLVEDESIQGAKVEESNSLKDEEKVHSYFNNSELDIRFCQSGYVKLSSIDRLQKNLILTYRPSTTKLNVSLTSGRLVAESITAKEANIAITSGQAEINSWKAETANISLTSGMAAIRAIDANSFKGSYTSGSFDLGFEKIAQASISGTSGATTITLPQDGGVVATNVTSGRVFADGDYKRDDKKYIYGDGKSQFSVNVTSGTITIKPAKQ